MASDTTILRGVLSHAVKDRLLEGIVDGTYPPGSRIVETRVARELGTSQAPVREALRDLELLRLVESEPFKGSRVRAFGNAELVEVYPVRAVLEELAAKEATKKLAGDVSALEAEVEAMREAGVRRLVCQSTLGVGSSGQHLTFWWRYVMFGALLRRAFADHVAQEAVVEASGLDWTIVRPSAFTDASAGSTPPNLNSCPPSSSPISGRRPRSSATVRR